MLTHAVIVAERHPQRQEKNRRSAMHSISYEKDSRRRSGGREKIETSYEGRRGFLYHLHGLLSTKHSHCAMALGNSMRESSTRRGGSKRKTDRRFNPYTASRTKPVPFWMSLKETAFRELGIARAWPLKAGSEIAGTVYAIKYMLKAQRNHTVTPERYEPTPIEDDWMVIEF